METRKVQMVGGGTYTVSLPKEWAESEGWTSGTQVNLHTHIDGVLVIQPANTVPEKTDPVQIEIGDNSPTEIEQILRAAYAAGVESVVLESPEAYTDKQRQAIKRVTRNLSGMTVTEETETQVTLKILLDTGEVSIRQSVRQLQFVALSMHRDALATLTNGATDERWSARDEQSDRLYAIVDRYFQRGLARLDEIDILGLTRPELFGLWATAHELERVADHAERIGVVADKIDDRPNDTIASTLDDIAQDAQVVVEDAVRVIIGDADVTTARQSLANSRDVCARITELDRRLFEEADTDYRLTRVLDSLARTAEHGSNIAEFGLRLDIQDRTVPDRKTSTNEPDTTGSATET